MAAQTTTLFDHEALKASLRSAKLVETDSANLGIAYMIRPAHAADDVLGAIGSYRQRYNHTPTWFEWRHPHHLILGPHL